MTQFVQIHTLTSYPTSCPNRDEDGRPKETVFGNLPRMRISSQSMKRAIRTSDVFQDAMSGQIGTRTKKIGNELLEVLVGTELTDKKKVAMVRSVVEVFGKLVTEANVEAAAKKEDRSPTLEELVRLETLVFVTPTEIDAAKSLLQQAVDDDTYKLPKLADIAAHIFGNSVTVDVGMFGRMFASLPQANCEAAVSVSHPMTTHEMSPIDDFFTAVDDLSDAKTNGLADSGSSHMGTIHCGAGVFYTYYSINRDLLVANVGDEETADKAIRALIESTIKVTPSGMKTSFANNLYAQYARVEVGNQQPRSLHNAFINGVRGELVNGSIAQLRKYADNMNVAYGDCYNSVNELVATVDNVEGSLKALSESV